MEKEQRQIIEEFVNQESNVMEMHQAQAVVKVIIETHDMVEKLSKASGIGETVYTAGEFN